MNHRCQKERQRHIYKLQCLPRKYLLETAQSFINNYKMATSIKCHRLGRSARSNQEAHMVATLIFTALSSKCQRTGVGLPHDLRSNYSGMQQLVGSTTEAAHCCVGNSQAQKALVLFQSQRRLQQNMITNERSTVTTNLE